MGRILAFSPNAVQWYRIVGKDQDTTRSTVFESRPHSSVADAWGEEKTLGDNLEALESGQDRGRGVS